jgi:hypothetical protein
MGRLYKKRIYHYYMDKKLSYHAGMISVISYRVPDITGDSKFRRFIYAK